MRPRVIKLRGFLHIGQTSCDRSSTYFWVTDTVPVGARTMLVPTWWLAPYKCVGLFSRGKKNKEPRTPVPLEPCKHVRHIFPIL